MSAPGTLTVRGLSIEFGGVHAVEDVSFEVRPGENAWGSTFTLEAFKCRETASNTRNTTPKSLVLSGCTSFACAAE